ncbi:MAG: FHA domain-containing protein [Acidimicrobiales bacterium]
MSEQLLTVLKLFLLVLLYLFFLRVLQAVWSEVRGPRPNQPTKPQRAEKRSRPLAGVVSSRRTAARGSAHGSRLMMVEPPEIAGTSFELGDEIVIGRSASCQITLDDTYVSQLHTRVFNREGRYFVEDLGSTNGTYLNRNKVSAPTPVNPGDRVQVGSTVLELG